MRFRVEDGFPLSGSLASEVVLSYNKGIMRRKTLSILAGLALLLVPLAASAEVVIDGEDTIVGVGETVTVTGLPPHTTVRIRITKPGGVENEFYLDVRSRGEVSFDIHDLDVREKGTYEITVVDTGGRILASKTIEAFAEAFSPEHSSIRVDKRVLKRGELTEGVVTIRDQYGNPLPGRFISVHSSNPEDEIMMLGDQTSADGTLLFEVLSKKTGESVLTAVDLLSGMAIADRATLRVRQLGGLTASLLEEFEREEEEDEAAEPFGFVDSFAVTVAERNVQVHEQIDVEISARDRAGRIVEDYVGYVVVEMPSDRNARVPLDPLPFLPSHRGVRTLPLAVAPGTPGRNELIVYDRDDDTIIGSVTLLVSGSERRIESGRIVVQSPGNGATVGSSVTVSGTAPAYINLDVYDIVDGREALLAAGGSDDKGAFSIAITLDTSQLEHTLIVREGAGGLDRASQELMVLADDVPPSIRSIALLPGTLLAGETFTVSVTAETGQQIEAEVAGVSPVRLTEGETIGEGFSTYQATMTAPASPGSHAVSVTIRDRAGNETSQSRTLTVQAAGLPVVQQLTAQPSGNDILLSWLPVEGAVSYRIYFGTSPTNLSRHIDTHSSVTSVRLTGLKSGQQYYFAITALGVAGDESGERSQVVAARTRGALFNVQLIPRINGAQMRWVAPPGLPIARYRIQYGVQPESYTEQRLVGSTMLNYDLKDLINGVTYFVRLSAVQEDGKLIVDPAEYSVVPGQNGQPGIHLSAPDPLPHSLQSQTQASPQVNLTPPTVPRAGVSFLSLVAILACGSLSMRFLLQWRTQQKLLASIAARYQA